MKRMRRSSWTHRAALFFGLACGACGGGNVPLELEIKDGAAMAGRRPDELELLVKTVPGVELKFEDHVRNTGDKATETFTIQKSALKLGKNTFVVEAKRGVLFSQAQAKAQIVWDAPAKSFLRFYPTGSGDGGWGALSCGGAMCGGPSFKISKGGKLLLEGESSLAGWVSVAGRRESVGPRQRKTFEVDVTTLLGMLPLAQKDTLPVPVVLEVGSEKAYETLTLQGNGLVDAIAAALAGVEKGPVTFPNEIPAAADPRAIAVVGLGANKLLVVGKATKVEELDLVAVAKPAERFFQCTGSSAAGILYLDLDIDIRERRTGKSIATRKLSADRVPCPNGAESRSPLPGAANARQVKAEVRESDVVKAMNDVLARGSARAAAPGATAPKR